MNNKKRKHKRTHKRYTYTGDTVKMIHEYHPQQFLSPHKPILALCSRILMLNGVQLTMILYFCGTGNKN